MVTIFIFGWTIPLIRLPFSSHSFTLLLSFFVHIAAFLFSLLFFNSHFLIMINFIFIFTFWFTFSFSSLCSLALFILVVLLFLPFFALICLFTFPFAYLYTFHSFVLLLALLLLFSFSCFTFAHSYLISFILSFSPFHLVSLDVSFILSLVLAFVHTFFFHSVSHSFLHFCPLFLLRLFLCLFFPSLSWLSVLYLAVFCQFLGWRVL